MTVRTKYKFKLVVNVWLVRYILLWQCRDKCSGLFDYLYWAANFSYNKHLYRTTPLLNLQSSYVEQVQWFWEFLLWYCDYFSSFTSQNIPSAIIVVLIGLMFLLASKGIFSLMIRTGFKQASAVVSWSRPFSSTRENFLNFFGQFWKWMAFYLCFVTRRIYEYFLPSATLIDELWYCYSVLIVIY